MSEHVLLVPLDGLMQVMHSETTLDYKSVLESWGHGIYTTLSFSTGTMHFLASQDGYINRRGREALAYLSGVYMVVPGPALFSGLSEEDMGGVVASLSLRAAE